VKGKHSSRENFRLSQSRACSQTVWDLPTGVGRLPR